MINVLPLVVLVPFVPLVSLVPLVPLVRLVPFVPLMGGMMVPLVPLVSLVPLVPLTTGSTRCPFVLLRVGRMTAAMAGVGVPWNMAKMTAMEATRYRRSANMMR